MSVKVREQDAFILGCLFVGRKVWRKQELVQICKSFSKTQVTQQVGNRVYCTDKRGGQALAFKLMT